MGGCWLGLCVFVYNIGKNGCLFREFGVSLFVLIDYNGGIFVYFLINGVLWLCFLLKI